MRNAVYFLIFISILSLNLFSQKSDANNNINNSKNSSISTGGAKGDAWAMSINNIHLPYNRKGVIADVNYGSSGQGGRYPGTVGKYFIFSGGFFLSGYYNEELFANAVASASLVEDYVQGTVEGGDNDPRAQIYVIQSSDEEFGTSWQQWSDAVELGADFYDGDGDGQYNPVDKNANGIWDVDEDKPDLIGDEMGWTVYNDGVDTGERRWNTVEPMGIEIRQSIFSFASAGALGNIVFVRYRLKYVGLGDPREPEELTDVYFGAWADPDIGGAGSAASDDLVGSDISRNAGYVYNDGDDDDWGSNPPCFMMDFLSGPVVYIPGETFFDVNGDGNYTDGIDVPYDSAYSMQGQAKSIVAYPGARNQGMTSFTHYLSSQPIVDPSTAVEARNYMEGKAGKTGEIPDPCTWGFGTVLGGIDCSTIETNFWYNGDPVTQIGWLNTSPQDEKMLTNTGPFILKKGEEKEIMIAYVIGQGNNAISSITEARSIDDLAQMIFDNNFDLTTDVELRDKEIENSFVLYQNYPNPFNPSTKIKYEIPKATKVQLRVLDILGREVAILVNEQKPAGSYEVTFNAFNLSNGVYFYELRTDGFRDIKKLLLLK